MTNFPTRNAPCTCGSGKRYKDCCGRLGKQGSGGSVQDIMSAALAAQRARRLDEAERLYREALAHSPDLPDALHMLGVIRYEMDDSDEARSLILRALELTNWSLPAYRHNLGLVIARVEHGRDEVQRADIRARYRRWLEAGVRARRAEPLVDVIVPSFNHARFVEHALRSVFVQTYRRIHLTVIDDGSTDGSPEVIARTLASSPFPHRFVARANRGAAATINDGVAMSNGEWVNVLNSDDVFEPNRVETMLDGLAALGTEWGFSAVSFIDGHGALLDTLQNRRAYTQACAMSAIPFRETVGFSLVTGNAAISSGNLFFSRALSERMGGFRDFRYNHDWDFCLRALRLFEPAFVSADTYRYRLHDANTIVESAGRARAEANVIMSEYLAWATKGDASGSPFTPSVANWGTTFIVTVLEGGAAELVDPALLRDLAIGFSTQKPVRAAAGAT